MPDEERIRQLEFEITELRMQLTLLLNERAGFIDKAKELRSQISSAAGYAELLKRRGPEVDSNLFNEALDAIVKEALESVNIVSTIINSERD